MINTHFVALIAAFVLALVNPAQYGTAAKAAVAAEAVQETLETPTAEETLAGMLEEVETMAEAAQYEAVPVGAAALHGKMILLAQQATAETETAEETLAPEVSEEETTEEETEEYSETEQDEEEEEEEYEEETSEEEYDDEEYEEEEEYDEEEDDEDEEDTEEEYREETAKTSEVITTASAFKRDGVKKWNGWRWTWYSEKVLPGGGLKIDGRHVDEDGFVCDGDGYICLASGVLSRGEILDTPFGKEGKVYDCGCAADTIDVYVSW